MWGALIGAAVSAASSIAGGIISSKKANKAKAELDRQKAENESWYNRRYNEDYLNTATAQHALSQAREAAMEQLNKARGVQAVMGGTEESVQQAQQQANQMLANTESSLAAQGQARKDTIENQYLTTANALHDKYQQMHNAQAQNITNAANGGLQAGMGLVGADINSIGQTGHGSFANMFKTYKKKNAGSLGSTVLNDNYMA